MSSSPAGLEEVINYADLKEEASVEPVEDESTLEDEPDEEDLQDLFSGNITVNESQIINLPAGKSKNEWEINNSLSSYVNVTCLVKRN